MYSVGAYTVIINQDITESMLLRSGESTRVIISEGESGTVIGHAVPCSYVIVGGIMFFLNNKWFEHV